MDQYILELVRLFQANPLHFFHEREIHSAFFSLGRERSGTAMTSDGQSIHLFRQDYNTLWRYRRRGADGFATRFSEPGEGDVGEIDFVLLRRIFVGSNRYLTVMNKEEANRRPIRSNDWTRNRPSPIIERGLEFKMAHVHSVGPQPRGQAVRDSDVDQDEIILDCRKLACERVGIGYSVTLTHQSYRDWLDLDYVRDLFMKCIREWNRCDDGPGDATSRLRLIIVSPTQCFRWGAWEVNFPGQVQVQAQTASIS